MIRINSNMHAQLGDLRDNLNNIDWKSFMTGWLMILVLISGNLVTKMKQSNVVIALSIDGLTSAFEVADNWRNHFIGIFNLKGSNTHRECYHRVVRSLFISAEDVEKAVKKLHYKKAPGWDSICEEHIIYDPGCVMAHLANGPSYAC